MPSEAGWGRSRLVLLWCSACSALHVVVVLDLHVMLGPVLLTHQAHGGLRYRVFLCCGSVALSVPYLLVRDSIVEARALIVGLRTVSLQRAIMARD